MIVLLRHALEDCDVDEPSASRKSKTFPATGERTADFAQFTTQNPITTRQNTENHHFFSIRRSILGDAEKKSLAGVGFFLAPPIPGGG
jgi:hypothetical protein